MTSSTQGTGPNAAQAWVLRSRALLERSAQDLDGTTMSRLNRARQAALDSLEVAPRQHRAVLRWLGGGAVAAGLVLVLWQSLLPTVTVPVQIQPVVPLAQEQVPAAPAIPATPVTAPDFELLADAERYALLEDLEFYAWLETETDTATEDQDG